MANVMNMVNLKNNVHRSGFDLSRRNCFTAKVGEILPVMCEEVLPGDKWRVNMREFMRTAPLQTASFGRVRQYYDFYFVPYSLLWDKFESWIVQTKNAFHAQSLITPADEFPTQPYFTFQEYLDILSDMSSKPDSYYNDTGVDFDDTDGSFVAYGAKKLMAYLNYPVSESRGMTSDFAMNPFPLLAYQKIYQDYFRFSQWEDAAPWTYNLDYILTKDRLKLDMQDIKNYTTSSLPTMFTLRYCNLDKDYFNGLLPTPQYGDTAIAGPLTGDFSGLSAVWATTGNSADMSFQIGPHQQGAKFYPLGYDATSSSAGAPVDLKTPRLDGYQGSPVSSVLKFLRPSDKKLVLPVTGSDMTVGLSILILRQAEALQKWKEITLSGDLDYKTQLQKHWGVNISDDNSYMCKYLGGISNNLDVSEVINNNITADNKAEIAGKGVSASSGNINFTSHQYGLIMCVYHCKPIIEWNANNVMPRMLTKTKATDYAIPEFDQIGMQSVLHNEFLYDSQSNWAKPIGYAPRYVEYKTSFDIVHGAFQNTLRYWVLPHSLSTFSDVAKLTFKAFKVQPNSLDNMFGLAVTADEGTDQFYCAAYFDAKVVRNLDRDGLPY